MGIFNKDNLDKDQLLGIVAVIPDVQLKTNFINVIESIGSKLDRLQQSLNTLAGSIPTESSIDLDPDYQTINRYLYSFATDSILDFENIVNDPNYDGDLDLVYNEFLQFDSVIDIINNNSDNIQEIVRQMTSPQGQASVGSSQGQSTGFAPVDNSGLFLFENEITLADFLENFDYGIHNFNEKVKEYNDNKKEFNTLYQEVDDNIHKRQTEETIDRANILISEKIEYYESWIKFMYYLHRILLVILCIIIIITLVYKLI